jgi:hypothetical protein
MPRFVLLYHACPPNYERPSHWDLMLEAGDALHTWALQELPRDWRAAQRATMAIDSTCPPVANGDAVDAQQLGHHRKSYLDYEGPLSGNRGQVHRIDSGSYVGEQSSPTIWRIALEGSTVRGSILLQQESDNVQNWVLRCEKG